jgi:hypothetical protein
MSAYATEPIREPPRPIAHEALRASRPHARDPDPGPPQPDEATAKRAGLSRRARGDVRRGGGADHDGPQWCPGRDQFRSFEAAFCGGGRTIALPLSSALAITVAQQVAVARQVSLAHQVALAHDVAVTQQVTLAHQVTVTEQVADPHEIADPHQVA